MKTVGADAYVHDPVGNQTGRPDGTTIAYTPFDLPERYAFTSGTNFLPVATVRFEYDGGQHRIRKTLLNADGAPSKETVYLDGLYERVSDASGDEHRFYVAAGSATVVLTRSSGGNDDVAYALTDALGSVDVITDGGGKVVEHRSYDAFGARRNPAGWGPWQGPLTSSVTTVGFEGLEADDEAGLVNMRGRIYDPKIGRFLSTDPLVSRPGFAQSWNPYSYVLNSPLNFTDPSGFQETPTDPSQQPLLPCATHLRMRHEQSCTVVKTEPPQRVDAKTVQAVTVAKDGARNDTPAKGAAPSSVDGPTIGASFTDPSYPDPKYRFLERATPSPRWIPIQTAQGVVGKVEPGRSLHGTWREETFPEYPGYSISVEDPDTSKVEAVGAVALAVVPAGVEMLAVRGGGRSPRERAGAGEGGKRFGKHGRACRERVAGLIAEATARSRGDRRSEDAHRDHGLHDARVGSGDQSRQCRCFGSRDW